MARCHEEVERTSVPVGDGMHLLLHPACGPPDQTAWASFLTAGLTPCDAPWDNDIVVRIEWLFGGYIWANRIWRDVRFCCRTCDTRYRMQYADYDIRHVTTPALLLVLIHHLISLYEADITEDASWPLMQVLVKLILPKLKTAMTGMVTTCGLFKDRHAWASNTNRWLPRPMGSTGNFCRRGQPIGPLIYMGHSNQDLA